MMSSISSHPLSGEPARGGGIYGSTSSFAFNCDAKPNFLNFRIGGKNRFFRLEGGRSRTYSPFNSVVPVLQGGGRGGYTGPIQNISALRFCC